MDKKTIGANLKTYSSQITIAVIMAAALALLFSIIALASACKKKDGK